MYQLGYKLSNNQYVYIDLFLVIPLSMTMGRSEPYEILSTALPKGSLMHPAVLTSTLGAIGITFFF